MINENDYIIKIFITSNCAIVLKIVWDWLKNRNQPQIQEHNHCKEPENCPGIMSIKSELAVQNEKNANVENILEEGKQEHKEMKKDIQGIGSDLKTLVSIARIRVKNGKVDPDNLFHL